MVLGGFKWGVGRISWGEAGIFTYLGEMFDSSAIFVEILSASTAKEPCRAGTFVCTEGQVFDFHSQVAERLHRTWPIWKVSTLGILSKESEVI